MYLIPIFINGLPARKAPNVGGFFNPRKKVHKNKARELVGGNHVEAGKQGERRWVSLISKEAATAESGLAFPRPEDCTPYRIRPFWVHLGKVDSLDWQWLSCHGLSHDIPSESLNLEVLGVAPGTFCPSGTCAAFKHCPYGSA